MLGLLWQTAVVKGLIGHHVFIKNTDYKQSFKPVIVCFLSPTETYTKSIVLNTNWLIINKITNYI